MKNEPGKQVLKMGLPKGSLQEAALAKMAKAGFQHPGQQPLLHPLCGRRASDVRLIRAQEISRYVEHGYLDCGITGHDWVVENGSNVHEVGEFIFSKATSQPARWVLAVPEDSPIKSAKDLQGKRIATEVVNITKRYLRKHGVKAEVEFSWGATEVKAHELVDAIVEITETGSSLRANKLRIVDTLLVSTPRLIVNHEAWKDPWKRQKIETLAMLLRGALEAETKVGLKMNMRAKEPRRIAEEPARLAQSNHRQPQPAGWVAVETIIDEKVVRELIPHSKPPGLKELLNIR